MRILKTDIVLALVGLGTTITVFLAQGPYNSVWKYALAISPVVLAGCAIATVHAFRRGRHFYRALLHAKEAYDLVTATDIKSTFTVRVLNSEGDLLYERYYNVVLLKDGVTVRKTKQDLVGSEIPIETFPPEVALNSSKPRNIQLAPTDVTFLRTTRGGRPHFDYRWSYEIVPPLRNKGDFVDYSYSAIIPKCEVKAFSEAGSLFFFHHESLPLEVHYSLIAPPKFKIVILESWAEDPDGVRAELPMGDLPQLDKSEQILIWRPSYRKRMCFICKYRLVTA